MLSCVFQDSWLYHLTVASGGGMGNIGTDYEQTISKLIDVGGDPGCMYWKHPIILHSKELISKPLTTLPSEELQKKALDIAQVCIVLYLDMGPTEVSCSHHMININTS